jgi:hypothetical protein
MAEHEHVGEPELESDALVGRIIDREATPRDCAAFERRASDDPNLWRTLALRHLDMAMLSDRVAEHTDAADRVDTPVPGRRRRPLSVAVTLSGWAAVLLLGLSWVLVVAGGRGAAGPEPAYRSVSGFPVAADDLTADEHFRRYLQGDNVLGELDPILLETEPLPDGRYRLRIIRRVEEYVDVDAPPSEITNGG